MGLDNTITKLKELNRILDNIQRKSAGINLGGSGGRPGSYSGGYGPSKAGGSSSSDLFPAAALALSYPRISQRLARFTSRKQIGSGNGHSQLPEPHKLSATHPFMTGPWPIAAELPILQNFENLGFQKAYGVTNGEDLLFGVTGIMNGVRTTLGNVPGVPPIIMPPGAGNGNGNGIGGGGGGAGGAAGGGAGGGFWKNLPGIILSVYAAFRSLKFALDTLIAAVERGANAFREAARYGESIQTTFQVTQALAAIGISGQATDRMLLQAEFNRRAKLSSVQGTSMLIGAARASQFGDVQQLTNMSKQFELAMKAAAGNARQMADSAGRNTVLSMMWNGTVRQFHTLLTQLTSALSPLIAGVLGLTNILLKAMNLILEGVNRLYTYFGFKGFAPPGQSRIPGMGGSIHAGTWSNIGFVYRSGGPEKHLSDIAKNTKSTSDKLDTLIKYYTAAKGVAHMLGVPSPP